MANIAGLSVPLRDDSDESKANKFIDGLTAIDDHDHSTGKGAPLSLTEDAIAQVIAPGTICDFAGLEAPEGWLLANGGEYLRENYPKLFTAIGSRFGSTSSRHFNVPNPTATSPYIKIIRT